MMLGFTGESILDYPAKIVGSSPTMTCYCKPGETIPEIKDISSFLHLPVCGFVRSQS